LDKAVQRLKTAAAAYDAAAAGAGAGSSPERLARANARLQGLEQSLTDLRGLPGRPWYKSLVVAPGVLTGYGSKTLPGVREAIEGRRWDEARDFIDRTAQILNAYSDGLDQATALLKP
jgi:N-acetylated-alpha-linked acidic dipeptidase